MGTISSKLRTLPNTIRHAKYLFQFQYREYNGCWWIGYFVIKCETRNKHKKAAFRLGVWSDLDPKYHTNSVGTPILTGIPLLTSFDKELYTSLRALERHLIEEFGYIAPISDDDTDIIYDADYEELRPLSIAAPKIF